MENDVFVSYSRTDLAFVKRLDIFLTEVGISTWFDCKSLLPGQRWEDVIDEEISRSRTFLTCLSAGAIGRRGFFHVEQQRASEVALRIPPEELFIIPVALGDCEVPRRLRQYHTVNLVEPGAIEMLLMSLGTALERQLVAEPRAVDRLRDEMLSHLGTEGLSNEDFFNRFMKTDDISFQDSMGMIERIANSSDSSRLGLLLRMRALDFLSYAEQAALDKAIDNVKSGARTEQLRIVIRADEMERISRMGIPGSKEATLLLQRNKYVRYVSRKGTAPYSMAEEMIRRLLLENNDH